MDHSQLVQSVRQLVFESFRQLGAQTDAMCDEALLFRGGYYCGRRFHCDDFEARWFAERNEIEFYRRDGSLVQRAKIADMHCQPLKRAA